MLIEWTDFAIEDMIAIRDHIAKDSLYYAHNFIECLFEVTNKLEDFPEIGRRVPEAEEHNDIRELIYQGYRIIYLVSVDQIKILAVIHGSRDLQGWKVKPWD